MPEPANISANTTSDPVDAGNGRVVASNTDVSKPTVKRAKTIPTNADGPAVRSTKIKSTETSRAKAKDTRTAGAAEKVKGSKAKRSTHKGKAGR